MKFKNLSKAKPVVRQFTKISINIKKLKKIISNAQQAPSLLNSQPWRVYISMPNVTNKIRAAYYKAYTNHQPANSELEQLIPNGQWDTREAKNILNYSDSIQFLEEGNFSAYRDAESKLYQAQILVTITIPKVSPAWSIYDLGSFTQCLQLAAKNEGVDSLILYKAAQYPEILRKHLNIPESEAIGIVGALGYRTKDKKLNFYSAPTLRLPVESVGKFVTE